MKHDLDTYRAAGRRAAEAARVAANEQRWLEREVQGERPEDRRAARVAFNHAYREVFEAPDADDNKP